MKSLPKVTLLGIDCLDIDRLVQVANICTKDFSFGAVKLLTSLPSADSRVVAIPAINSIDAYSKFAINELDKFVDTEFVLIIQYDGFILNPNAWTDDFLAYDYIGAPWWKDEKYIVGNGGFSMRSKKLTSILKEEQFKLKTDIPEDWYICVTIREELEKRGIKFAPAEVARRFSFESNEKDGVVWISQFGFHGLKWTDISSWLSAHPEYPMKNELDSWALATKKKFSES